MFNLKVKIKKSELALNLEKELGISWDLIQQHSYDAGYDLRACIPEPICIPPGMKNLVPTGIHMEMNDHHWEGQVRPRSGLAAKNGITIINSPGTIDAAYRGEIIAILLNTQSYVSCSPFYINPGDRIAQLCFRWVPEVSFSYENSLSETERGEGGFGSTGSS